MPYLFLSLIFLFGAAVGSFIAVIANRYNTGLPFLRGRSICFSCNMELKNRDLFPIFSFIFLRGRCRNCDSKIPKETLIIELLMGGLSVLAAFKSGLFSLELKAWSLEEGISYLIITAIFAVVLLISVYDLKHFIIPDSFLISLFILSLLYIFLPLSSQLLALSLSHFLSALIVTLPFLLIFLISKGRWIGFGDIKYILVLGFLLGLSGGLSAVILSFWIGAAFSVTALSLKYLKSHINLPNSINNLTIKSEIPFGPFLSIGIIISLYLNADLFQINSLFNAF